METATPTVTERDLGGGLKEFTELRTNEQGQKIKIVRKVRMVLTKRKEIHAVAERKRWRKFGQVGSANEGGGTSLAEEVELKLSANKNFDLEEQATSAQENTKKLATSNITCRTCKGDHWTSRCPYKDTLTPLDDILGDKPATPAAVQEATSGKPGKYVPPSRRAGAAPAMGVASEILDSEAQRRKLEDACTIRVSNLSEDAEEDDVRALFSRFGTLTRCFVARHHDTNTCKGYAFVCFRERDNAARAIKVMNGYGFDNLILSVDWTKPQTN